MNFRRAYIKSTEPKWQKAVLRKMVELMDLPSGWDSYGAMKPNREAAMFALEVLERLMHVDTPVPSIVPSHSGGIQLEWHLNQVDLEIHTAWVLTRVTSGGEIGIAANIPVILAPTSPC